MMERFARQTHAPVWSDPGVTRHQVRDASSAVLTVDTVKLLASAIRVILLLGAAAGFAQRSGIVSVFWF
jgi:hypothetical protein